MARQGISYSCMKQPSLIKQLKGILSEYPDGGQILKELIQNAEDAEASEVKILYDSRHINNDTNVSASAFNKFFKGPALCVYNNAVFSEEDWEGIQMIYSSKKENKPLKVGRFGLGFKSVFHLTDFPSVLSGDKLLMIDPTQPMDMVNALVSITDIENLEGVGLDCTSFLAAFEDTFGFRREHISNGLFYGTLFWFPLREHKSLLSENLYDESQIMSLFEGFECESSSLLIFLKSLESISLWIRGDDRVIKGYSKVAFHDEYGLIRQKRSELKQNVIRLHKMSEPIDIHDDISMTVEVLSKGKCALYEWLIVNYFIGGSASDEFMALIQDETLGYIPYVGVATLLNAASENLDGHIFCFLPLPREGTVATGLPVHVNGFFALSQNRHHLKCATEEQSNSKISDKAILWNEHLIHEALPLAYAKLIEVLVKRSISLGNTHESVANIYSCLPIIKKTQKRWVALEKGLYEKLKNVSFLYAMNRNIWIPMKDAFFATFRHLPESHTYVKDSVIRGMCFIGKSHIKLTTDLFITLQKYFPETEDLSPERTVRCLRENPQYENIISEDKLDILAYILSEDKSYKMLDNLALLPLASGEWARFDKLGSPIFVCSENVIQIFHDSRGQFLRENTGPLIKCLDIIVQDGLFQLKALEPNDFKQLLECTLKTLPGYKITDSTSLTIKWLCEVWQFIVEQYELNLFSDIHLVPVLHEGTWLNPKSITLLKLSGLLLIKKYNGEELSNGICDAFEMMSVNIVKCLPEWIPYEKVKHFFFWPKQKSIIALLSKIHTQRNDLDRAIYVFNRSCSVLTRCDLLSFFMTCYYDISQDTGARNILKQLRLFPVVNLINDDGNGNYGSVAECQEYINGTECFPKNVSLPFQCLLVESSYDGLMKCLGARKVQLDELVIEFLRHSEKNKTDVSVFMEYFVKNFYRFQNNPAIVSCAQNVPFLSKSKDSARFKACELFDPTNASLQDLLYNESLTPEFEQPLNDDVIICLRVLGLRDESAVDANVLLKIAQTLHKWAGKKLKNIKFEIKAAEFMRILSKNPFLLNKICSDSQNLKEHLASLSCICVQKESPESYPKCIPWYKHDKELCSPIEARDVEQSLLVGGIMPTVVCKSDELSEIFHWKKSPPFENIIQQLRLIKDCFTVKMKSEVMPSIKKIFDHMNKNLEDASKYKSVFKNENLMWTGEKFVSAERVTITSSKDDIDLQPYFFSLSPEYYEFDNFFKTIGCQIKQDEVVLQNALHFIKLEHRTTQLESIVNRDRLIVCNILAKLAQMKKIDNHSLIESKLLIMVKDYNINTLKLHPIRECTFDDDPSAYSNLDDNIYLVHEMIPLSVAEDLGVHSISRKAVLEADEFDVEEWDQNERLTTRINTLLRYGYTDGLSVPKELIQNADDAGASDVKFLYDERLNREFRERVLSKGMRGFQGPALWAFNNSVFTEDDLHNIRRLNAGTKQADSKKIGRFGLGFCSVYNITDLPSFITGSSIVFFDPQEKYLGGIKKCKGLRYKLPNQTLVSRHIDQFQPYNGIFNCDIMNFPKNGYQGSLFRLPLRTSDQAKVSEIFNQSYTHEDILKLLELTIEAAGNMILFTQNVKRIEIYHLAENATDAANPELLFTVKRNANLLNGERIQSKPILSRISALINTVCLKETYMYCFEQTVSDQGKAVLGIDSINSKTNWIVSWATGNKRSLEMYNSCLSDNALPVGAVAIPCCNDKEKTVSSLESIDKYFYRLGHIFCFLPLPIKTGFPVHINGCFWVSQDRRQLVLITDDDKDKSKSAWNDALMEDALVNAYVNLLESIQLMNLDKNYRYFDLWPMECAKEVIILQYAFYKYIIVTNANVFNGKGKWLPFENVIFLNPILRQGPLGDIMFHVASYFEVRPNKYVIEMPYIILENIQKSNEDILDYIKSKTIDEREISLLVIKNINSRYWIDKFEKRNQLLHFALNLCDGDVNDAMKMTNCIPTLPYNRLRKPLELINPECSIALLFDENDERFPRSENGFRDTKTLKLLIDIGMITKCLPHDLLLDRCMSIAETTKSCCICAFDKCKLLMAYMSDKNVLDDLELDIRTIDKISEANIFPVLPMPKNWVFSWKANESHNEINICQTIHENAAKRIFGKAKDLFTQNLCDFVGTVEHVADESIFGKDTNKDHIISILHFKGIKETKEETIVNQMENISAEYNNTKTQYNELKRIHRSIFGYFEKCLSNECRRTKGRKEKHVFERLGKVPVVLVHRHLVKTCTVAFNLKNEFPPLLYKVPSSARMSFSTIYEILGVKNYFSIDDVLKAFDFLKISWNQNKEIDIENTNSLLSNLLETMENSKLSFDHLSEKHQMIVAPDIHHRLIPTNKLVIEDEEFVTTDSMNILNPGIVPYVAKYLGVSKKKSRCFDDISKGIPFGQKETLGNRIKGLLSTYPCDSSIMSELLQNADDAGATEINFVKDYRNHSTKRLFSETCEPLQGPSLCVHNNSYFTEKDIEGIHNLGQGSKQQDPSKTGQYGVGFNSVYHLTDAPSFLTQGPEESNDGLLVFLDPLCKYVPKANPGEPGQMCSLDGVRRNFPDHLLGFNSNILIKNGKGTVFRFPLRTEKSNISTEIVDIETMNNILLSFKEDMYDSLLFLKNITCITISNITTGKYCEEYSVHVNLVTEAKRRQTEFNSKIHCIVKKNYNNKALNLEIPPFNVVYKMKISDSKNYSKRWLVVQKFGFGKMTDIEVIKEEMIDGKIGQLPLGGVAIPLDENKPTDDNGFSENKSINARAFCFLPLPLRTGFPVHVNGHFSLDHEARRNIGKEGYKLKWNYCIADNIIIPSWITGLIQLKRDVERKICQAKTWKEVNCVLDSYHRVFPCQNQTYDEFWNDLIHTFYKVVLNEKKELFPCVYDTESKFSPPSEFLTKSKCKFQILWCYISKDSTYDSESGVFNDLQRYMRGKGKEHSNLIEDMLKSFGFKLVSAPSKIWKFVMISGNSDIHVSTPDLVIKHFKNITSSDKIHLLGKMNTDISKTKFKSSFYLNLMIDFLNRDKNLYQQIQGLPILLTADSVLRYCSKEFPAYVSEFVALLPNSSMYFVHHDIYRIFNDLDAFETDCFKQFKMNDFVKLLPENKDVNEFTSGEVVQLSDSSNDSKNISYQWLCTLYNFLVSESLTKDQKSISAYPVYSPLDGSLHLNDKTFLEHLTILGKWSFLPFTSHDIVGTEINLIAFEKAAHIIYLHKQNLEEKVENSLQKLALPELSVHLFKKCRHVDSLIRIMQGKVASIYSPSLLLECLVHHCKQFDTFTLTSNDARNIMSYFAENLSALKKGITNAKHLQQKIKVLPLFLTQQLSLTSVLDKREVIVLPNEIPCDGIQEWADELNVTLLMKNDSVQVLYNFLGFTVSDVCTVYAENILPNIDKLPRNCWISHIDFLRKRIIDKKTFSSVEKSIIDRLRLIPFIPVGNQMKIAGELYSPKNNVFVSMLDDNCFPPVSFLSNQWHSFLVHLGLITIVDDAMLLQFAQTIEREGCHRMTSDIKHKSGTLFNCFVGNATCWTKQTLIKLKTIKFIIPFKVTHELMHVFRQFDDGEILTKFENMVSEKQKLLCWTSMSLMNKSSYDNIDESVRKTLQIYQSPPLEKFILHCQNVCDSLKSLIKSSDIDHTFIEMQMKKIYKYMKEIGIIHEPLKSRLLYTPIIYLPEDRDIVTINDIVIGLPECSQIKPFLYSAPVFYGEYFEVFKGLGCMVSVDFCHYARVLEMLRNETQGKSMIINECDIAKKAIQGLISLKPVAYGRVDECKYLYLPNRDMVLMDAKDLVLSDHISYERRLQQSLKIEYFYGFDKLNIQLPSTDKNAILSLPTHLRPTVLTEAVIEDICLHNMKEIENSSKSLRIETFLHSEHLANGLKRLLKHQSRKRCEKYSDSLFNEIHIQLETIKVIHVTNIKTILYFKGDLIKDTDMERYCFTKTFNTANDKIFYFKDDSKIEKIPMFKLVNELTKLVLSCSKGLHENSALEIMSMLQDIENPHTIQAVLDECGIEQFDVPITQMVEHFPNPGTAVDKIFLPFLEQGIYPFKDYEYKNVAMDLDDEADDIDYRKDPVYIYVHIIRDVSTPNCSNLSHVYLVDTGNPDIQLEKIPIYRLFRFVRKKEDVGNTIERFSDVPVFVYPVDENCERIREELLEAWKFSKENFKRVIRRLYFKWYPDRNPENREYCTQVFNYILIVISRLENEEVPNINVRADIAKGRSDMRTTSFYYANLKTRAEAYVQAFNDNIHEYRRSIHSCQGLFCHAQLQRPKRKDITEAKRWLRQAKCDFLAAKTFASVANDVDGFNWICYTCHQACEKALKSAYYAKDADNVPRGSTSHSLSLLAFDDEMREQARLIEDRLGDHTRLRYPDALTRPNIPSDLFKEDDAKFAIEITGTLLNLVGDFIA